MIESFVPSGSELTSSLKELGKEFNPDSPAIISTKKIDVNDPFSGENKVQKIEHCYNPDERGVEWKCNPNLLGTENSDVIQNISGGKYPIGDTGLSRLPLFMQETSFTKNAVSEVNVNPDSRAEVSKRTERTPVNGNGGHWDGERGNSNWIPDDNEIPSNPRTNPDGKTWREIKDEYGIEKIPYNDNKPDFSETSKGTVEIDDFSDDRDANFDQADEALAEQKGCEPEDVYKWRKEHKYTWHECSDCKTMQKVPTEVHGNVPHSGGVSEYKSRNTGA